MTDNLSCHAGQLSKHSQKIITYGNATHTETPFADQPSGDLHLSLKIIALLRLLFPKALIPATTAFGSMHPQGRELALKAGGKPSEFFQKEMSRLKRCVNIMQQYLAKEEFKKKELIWID